ncbi:hypothetical protein [Larkinella bovis]
MATLLTAAFLFMSLSVSAQPDAYSTRESGKGYWKIQTDYATRSTVIRFYQGSNEPIYQETLHGKYVKLTRRNMRLFDEMLDRVINSHLLASQLRSYDLLASNDLRFSRTALNVESADSKPVVMTDANRTFMVNPLVNEKGKLRINFANPAEKPVVIELTDENVQTVYYNEMSRLAGYNRYFDVTHLLSGRYRLQVKRGSERLAYWLTIDKPNRRYELKAAR